MKKIVDYRKLLGVEKTTELKVLKTVYRNLMKDWHPDKFQESAESQLHAEEKSKTIIEAYHFLVSIAPETLDATKPEFILTTSASNMADYEYKSQILKVTFLDGNVYEFFDVPKNIYVKLVNAESPARYARRHIYNSFVYRSVNKLATA